ncbi:DNA phosphorothioation-associated putative methyltransferase [Xanthobacter agilis]
MPQVSAKVDVIHRHRTAMVRHELSQPMAIMVRHGLLKPGGKVFDYGCGQGDDIRILTAAGIDAAGWDPHFRPDEPLSAAPIVNLGFVLNVIENPAERWDALKRAWTLTERILSVSTMIVGQVPVGGLKPHADGYLTSRGTFQKYFQQAELAAFISQTLSTGGTAVAPGIFLVFRQPEDEQDFLFNRRAARPLPTSTYRRLRETQRPRPIRLSLLQRVPQAAADIINFIGWRGRAPHPDEIQASSLEELAHHNVSLARATAACLEAPGAREAMQAASLRQREALLVHYALGLLNRTSSAARPSSAMIRDIRMHFRSQKEMAVEATKFLRALADDGVVAEALTKAAEHGYGILDRKGRLLFDGEQADNLPGLLRCYIGCAMVLSGEPEGRFLTRIDSTRRRVTMWPIVDPKAALPMVESRIEVDLRRQEVIFRPDRRRVVRKSDLFRMALRSKQRRLEAAYRAERSLPTEVVFESID